MVMYSSTGRKIGLDEGKDTVANIRATGEFVANVVSYALRDAMNATSGHYPAGEDEFRRAGLTPAPSRVVAPPRVAEAPAALECRAWKVIDLPGAANAHGDRRGRRRPHRRRGAADGRVDVTRYQPLARLGYRDYAAVREVFALNRPGDNLTLRHVFSRINLKSLNFR